jgi:aminoglycoside phosphotransferase (APT) family kinase protein
MPALVDPATLTARLPAALSRHLGATGAPQNMQRVTGGATKGTWIFEANLDGQWQRLVLQLTTARAGGDPVQATRLTAEHDAQIMNAARAQRVPAPEVCAVLLEDDGLGPGHITRWVAGETLAPKILRDPAFALARPQLAAQCAQALAGIHSIPASTVEFLTAMDAHSQWQRYRTMVDRQPVEIPALEWGLRWVYDHLPVPQTLTVVHGDFRLGNLIINERGLACVIDWELAALGDPMQDLGWLCLKTWRFGGSQPVAGVGLRESLYQAYQHASGVAVDAQRVRFWEAFGHVKWAIMCLGMGLGTPGSAPGAVGLEHSVIGRRVEEPLWDLLQLLEDQSS